MEQLRVLQILRNVADLAKKVPFRITSVGPLRAAKTSYDENPRKWKLYFPVKYS